MSGLEFQGLTGVAAISLTGGAAAAPPVPLDDDGVPTLTADLSEIQSIRDTLHNVDRVLVSNQATIKDGLLSFETYTASLASKGDAIEKIIGKADDAFASFDSAMTRIDNIVPGLADGKADELFREGEVDPRTRRDLQQEVRHRDGGRPPLAARYQPGRHQGDPQIRPAGRRTATTPRPPRKPNPKAANEVRCLLAARNFAARCLAVPERGDRIAQRRRFHRVSLKSVAMIRCGRSGPSRSNKLSYFSRNKSSFPELILFRPNSSESNKSVIS